MIQMAPPAAAASANGYAAQNGGTTGGTGGAVVTASTGTQIHQALCNRASDSTPIIIQVSGTITVGNTTKVSGDSCNTADGVIEIKEVSNVTILGVGSGAVFDQVGIHVRSSSNIIIQNVTVQNVKKSGSPTSNGGDAIGMESDVSNVWVDHNTLIASGGESEGYDGLLDMKANTNYVTVSYNIFRNSGRGGLVGSSDSDTGNGPVTFHHNWYQNIDSRTPLLRSATAHLYNNYYQQLNESGINPRNGGRARVENNYFQDSKNVLGTFYTDLPGYWQTNGNILDNVTWSAADDETNPAGPSMASNASVSVGYSYSLDPASCVPSIVQSTAGAGKSLATSSGSCSGGTTPATTTTTTTTRSTTTTTASTSQPATTTTTTSAPSGGGLTCTTTTSAWNGGFVTSLTVGNPNGSTVSGWTATLSYGSSVAITAAWGASASASGSTVTVSGTDWASNIPANGSVSVGFQGTASGTVGNPSCSMPGGSTPSTSSTTSTTSAPTTTTTRAATTTTTGSGNPTTTTTTRPTTTATTTTSSGAGTPSGTNLSLGAGADGSSKASGTSYGNVIDGDTGTSWSPSSTTGRISVKWSSAVTVGSAVIREASGSVGNIRSWQLVNNDSGAVLATGTNGIGTVSFTPTSLKKINLEILAANGTPAVAEFETYGSGGSGSSSTSTTTTTTTSSGGSGSDTTSPTAAWPSATGTTQLTATMNISGTFDGKNMRYQGWGGSQAEGQDPLFQLADGAVLKNVIIGDAAGDGVHCSNSCTLINVWWEDVGEDAATQDPGASATSVMTIDGGGARHADDKVFQHNGDGTMVVKNFQVSDFGKLIRHCGNCTTSHQRDSVIQNVIATGGKVSIVGINTNWGDTSTIRQLTVVGTPSLPICEWYNGVAKGSESSKTGSGPSEYCKYSSSDVTYR